ncbi:AraC family transcriptional regulator [Enterococcus termitis]|uniref:HTH araC/xylS-type domain-containing protein n=1 Tax=Enterococcus termitis TaxID=332950 RepID=A0A1E5H5V1_9ENTE|nr:helix-turn-helix domain-containing protein [Enterococcus termitis]OEG20311.1 hypothetical protein BCR25_00340 [Enterococcus termitis]OJG97265.1 hypothetical protein RV18_GL000953 [Enterococcus termitis]
MNYRPKVWQERTNHYQEILPDPRLQPYIQSYWLSLSKESQSTSRIIPDLCSDLIIQLNREFAVLSIKLCGPSTTFFYSYGAQEDIYFGIRFHLGGMYPFLKYSFKEMKNQLWALEEVQKNMSQELSEQLSPATSVTAVIQCLDQYFLKKLNQLDNELSTVISTFINAYSCPKEYGALLSEIIISERSLQRLFKEEIGLTPYEVFDILRFQKVYQEIARNPQIKHLDLVTKYAFFDQSHYSKKMKKMTGLTPQEISTHVGIIQDSF